MGISMLIKFESKKAASFIMQSQIAEQLLSMMGQGGSAEGSISGVAISDAITSLDHALAAQSQPSADSEDEESEQDYVSLDARAVPLQEMLRHAERADSYVMWRPE